MNNELNKSELYKYTGNYSGEKLWNKLLAVAKNLGKKTIWYVLLLYYTLQSDEVSLGNKAIIMGALGYLILPIDLIPDVVPVLGLTDDVAAITMAYNTVKASITPEIKRKAAQKLRQWFGDKEKTPADLIEEMRDRPSI